MLTRDQIEAIYEQHRDGGEDYLRELADQAHRALELEAELESLRQELLVAKHGSCTHCNFLERRDCAERYDAAVAERDRLQAENHRLRTALSEVDGWDINWADGLDSNVERIKQIVRRALLRED